MSKNSKIERAAKIHSVATGVRWYQSKALAAEGVISPSFPIPDAVSLQQQHFEAQILFALVEAFGQIDFCDYFLGLDPCRPRPSASDGHGFWRRCRSQGSVAFAACV